MEYKLTIKMYSKTNGAFVFQQDMENDDINVLFNNIRKIIKKCDHTCNYFVYEIKER